jgi:cytochrome P450
MMHERRANGGETDEGLSRLLRAQAGRGEATGVTDNQGHDDALTLLLAGHEPTAVALTSTWSLLSQYHKVEATLPAALTRVLVGRPLTAADLPHLPSPRMVLSEAMRLFPPAWRRTRRTRAAYKRGGDTVPAGTFLMLRPDVTHRDARCFAAPEVCAPDRWAAPVAAIPPP